LSGSLRYGFDKQQRLLKGAEFKAVKSTRFKAVGQYLLLLAIPNSHPTARLGLAITKRNAKLAVQRNNIKRVARESFRHHCSELPNLDIVLLTRTGVTKLTKQELSQCLDTLWKQLAKRAASC
jgi:ribonuclease P protein component